MNYFVYFRDNGENGCFLAESSDGFRYTDLPDTGPLFKPTVGKEKLVRDPCPVEGPDGTFHMVWTCGWWESQSVMHPRKTSVPGANSAQFQ